MIGLSSGVTRRGLAVLVGLSILTFLSAVRVRAEKGSNEGIYRDAGGGQHTWRIEPGHVLTWDEKPYVPAGVVFHSAYLKSPSESQFSADEAALDRWKAAGILDIWVDAGRPLLAGTNEQIQRFLDALERRGFRYGLRLAERSQEPLVGFAPELAPIKVRASTLIAGQRLGWQVPARGARRVIYSLVETGKDARMQTWAIANGETIVDGDAAAVQVQLPQSRLLGKSNALLLVVPEIHVRTEDLGSYGDLWDGLDGAQSTLKKRLQGLKFGPGLRFVLDPFSAGDGTVGAEDGVFPSSASFQQAFRSWLLRRYGQQGVNVAWRVADKKLPTLDEAARAIPLWSRNDPPEGDGWLLDPEEGVAYRCTPRQSSIWRDLDSFRADTLKRWMNRLTAALKQDGMNVPMLFSWAAYHPIFTNSPSPSGYDGLGATLGGPDGAGGPAFALAQAEESDRCTWLVATRLGVREGITATAAWTMARNAGFRGAYLDPSDGRPVETMVREVADAVRSDTSLATEVPRVCFFPIALLESDRVTRLSNGVWWVPGGGSARLLRLGDSILGYEIASPLGDGTPIDRGTVLWSTSGKQDATFYVDPDARIAIFDSAGRDVKPKMRRGELKLTLTQEPIVAVGVDTNTLFPLEMAAAQLDEFDRLIRAAEAQNAEVKALRSLLDDSRRNLTPSSAASIHAALLPHVTRLREQMTPYIWLEGERPSTHNFGAVAFQPGCSGGLYLKLDRATTPLSGVYRARYTFEIRREAAYEMWLAGRIPGREGISSIVWQLDEEPPGEVTQPTAVGGDYVEGMSWFNLGKLTLQPGRHELSIVVPDRAGGDRGRYSFGVDAIVISRVPFRPAGAQKPPLQLAPDRRRPEMKSKDSKPGDGKPTEKPPGSGPMPGL